MSQERAEKVEPRRKEADASCHVTLLILGGGGGGGVPFLSTKEETAEVNAESNPTGRSSEKVSRLLQRHLHLQLSSRVLFLKNKREPRSRAMSGFWTRRCVCLCAWEWQQYVYRLRYFFVQVLLKHHYWSCCETLQDTDMCSYQRWVAFLSSAR